MKFHFHGLKDTQFFATFSAYQSKGRESASVCLNFNRDEKLKQVPVSGINLFICISLCIVAKLKFCIKNLISKGGFFKRILFNNVSFAAPQNSTLSEDASIEPRTVVPLTLAVRCFKGTVAPDWIGLKVVWLNRPWGV
jgi:hypothetical protein